MQYRLHRLQTMKSVSRTIAISRPICDRKKVGRHEYIFFKKPAARERGGRKEEKEEEEEREGAGKKGKNHAKVCRSRFSLPDYTAGVEFTKSSLEFCKNI